MSPGWGVALAVALGTAGWGLVVAAVTHGAWGVGGGQATAVATVTVTRGLWSDCATDASGVTSCVPLVSLVTLPGYLQGSRALAVASAALGAPGVALGGGAGPRRRLRAAGGALLLLAAVAAAAAAGWFGAAVTREFFDPQHGGVRYEPGPGVLLAAGGGALAGVGGAGLLGSARGPPQTHSPTPPRGASTYGRNEYV
ncbi:claudin-15 [Patagioenas fasciata]|uniref:claudin-15 n=1 Tax=Patagioenas fasciata TaxID=372321 RepID=UPI003A99DB7F